jgi:hypothetical protein
MTQQSSGAVPAVPPTQTTVGTALPTGRGWAYTGAILGITVSVTANIAHARIPTHPHTGAVAFAALWPLFLFVTIEIMARTPWPHLHRWKWVRFGGLTIVGVVAAIVSYRHQAGLLAFYGEDALTTVIGPLAVDGLLLTATGALIATSRTRQATTVTSAAPVIPTPAPGRVAQDKAATVPPPVTPPRPPVSPPDRSRAYVASHPDMTRDQQAAALGISPRTLARHLAQPTKLTAVNGGTS